MRANQPDAESPPCPTRAARTARRAVLLAVAACTAIPALLRAQSMFIPTVAGNVEIPLVHVDPGGSLLRPTAPSAVPFSAPTIFSAPLPSGSGARALGLSGAFTAVADDATAASWSPAGLTQLERPELSLVYRFKQERDRHWSGNPDYQVGTDDDSGSALNYLSAVLPFRLFERNAVCSLNFQEVYDFSQRFHADFANRTASSVRQVRSADTADTVVTHFAFESIGYVDVTEFLTTRKTTTLDQRFATSTLGTLGFEQEGGIQAVTPALALELTPKVSVGGAINVYQEGLLGTSKIHSHTSARYSGTTDSRVAVTDQRVTTGTYVYRGLFDLAPPVEDIPFGPDGGEVTPYATTETSRSSTQLRYEGTYDVYDSMDDFSGVNATLGGLWTVNEKLTLGGCLDLPWTATARQTKIVTTSVRVADAWGTTTTSRSETAKDVEFDFPLYWATGAAWRWNNRVTTSFDVSQTLWSDYSFKADGEPRLNPLDGSPYGEHPVDDGWALRTGTEYLWVLSKTEIPFRCGLSWEQRPAIGTPDDYWGVSLGSGVSLGQGAHKVIIDVAYIYSWGDDVMGTLVPGQQDTVGTDVRRHDVFVSCIYHF